MSITRVTKPDGYSVTAHSSIASSTVFEYGGYSGGTIVVPSGSPITTLTFYSTVSGVDYPLYDSAGVAVTLTVAAARAYAIPAACFGCATMKMAANSTGTVTVLLKG